MVRQPFDRLSERPLERRAGPVGSQSDKVLKRLGERS